MKNMLFVLVVLLPASLVAAEGERSLERERSLRVPLETIHGDQGFAFRRQISEQNLIRREAIRWAHKRADRRACRAILPTIEESPEVSPSSSPRESKVSVSECETKS